MKYSLRSGLTALWIFTLIISISIGAVLLDLFRQRVSVQLHQVTSKAEVACAAIKDRYDQYFAGLELPLNRVPDPRIKRELTFLLEVVLSEFDGMEGGIWNSQEGFAAYAYPTYQGTAPKRDVPEAERQRIVDISNKVSAQGDKETLRYDGRRESLILHACPLSTVRRDVAWTMIRIPLAATAPNTQLMIGLATLFLFALFSGAWLLLLQRRWSKQVDYLENAIAGYPLEQLPALAATGEKDLDRIVAAINHLSTRLAAAREESAELSKRLAQTDRLAALGRMAAALAHEIRNPIAAMRLKAENALAQTPERQHLALKAVLEQVQRLDSLLQRLMAIIQPLDLQQKPVALRPWLEERTSQFLEQAEEGRVSLRWEAPEIVAVFDSNSLGRALDNLVLNALQHVPTEGAIEITATANDGKLVLAVEDDGPGVPEKERAHIFEPFMTTRAEGSGLGLAVVREIVEAHGGTVRCERGQKGARFEMELPWRRS
jgi:signal transduction histidine kinase